MTRLLVLMGSGETTPTMVETHKRVLAEVGDDARLVDTPYGFQANVDDLTEKTQQYFSHNVGHHVEPIRLRDVGAMSPAAVEDALAAAEHADWLFAGPGSPTYALRQWTQTRFPELVRERLRRDGTATVFASAAVCSVGRRTVPVYEIYKVGEEPHWAEGLDLLRDLDLDCVVIPHFDNAEGGGHDTRFCYLGEHRLAMMEAELPDDTWVLGVDEHTALVVDLDTGACRIEGRGGVTVRVRDRVTVFTAEDEPTLDDLRAAAAGEDVAATTPTTAASDEDVPTGSIGMDAADADVADSPLLESVVAHESRFREALAAEDAVAAADALLALERELRAWEADSLQSDELDQGRATFQRLVVTLARTAQTGLHDHRDLLAPFVNLLLDLRADARDARDFDTADRIRDAIAAGDVEVRDTPEGAEWVFDG